MAVLAASLAVSQVFVNNLNTLTSSTEFINDSADFLPQLHLDAPSDVEILRKFPFLTTLKAMANALEASGVVGSSQQNPHSYDKYTMAEKVFAYLNTHLDFATGKAPTVIQNAYESGYIMSQKDFWTNTKGLYTLLEDPGYGAASTSLTSGGHHYVSNPTATSVTTPANTGSYHSAPITAAFTGVLSTSSFIDYADFTNDGSVDYVDVATTGTGIDSDDIAGLSWEVSGVKGTAPDGSEFALTGFGFPVNIPGQALRTFGTRAAPMTGANIDIQAGFTLSDVQSDISSGGYTGTAAFVTKTNIRLGNSSAARQVPILHFNASAGVTSYARSMTGTGSDVNPEFGLVAPHFADQYLEWSGPSSFQAFDIHSMYATDDSQIPSGATIDAIDNWNSSTYLANAPSASIVCTDFSSNGQHHVDYFTDGGVETASPVRIAINSAGDGLEMQEYANIRGWGMPIYGLKIKYTPSGGSQVEKTYHIPFHYLCNWSLVTARCTPVVKTIGVGVTGNMTATVVDKNSASVGLTGYKTCASIASITTDKEGAGYDNGQAITATFPVPDGRFYNHIYGGKAQTGRSNNNRTIKNTQATATMTVTSGRIARQVETIYHSTDFFGLPGAHDYRQRGFLGADFNYEKDNFARRFVLNSDNKITSIDANNATPNTTLGTDSSPGYEYDINYYHAAQNPHGVNTDYVTHTFGSGEADARYFSKATGSFDVTVSGGVVTAISPRSRDDAAGTATQGGWNYGTSSDYTELEFYQNPAVTFPSDYVAPFVHIRTTATADNSQGNKATVDITDATLEFYHGKNVPDNAFLYAMAPGAGDKAMAVQPDADFQLDGEYFQRNWRPSIDPASVRINVERPLISTQSRSLKTKTVGTGAHRMSFEFEYPAMTQSEAEEVLTLFEKFKGGTQEIQLNIPNQAIKHLGGIIEDHFISRKPTIVGGGTKGSTEIVVDGFQDSGATSIPVDTYFTINGTKKIYKVVGTTAPNKYGRAELRIEPPLVDHRSNFRLDTDNFFSLRREYFMIRAFVEDTTIDYTVDAAGMYRLSAIRFRESI